MVSWKYAVFSTHERTRPPPSQREQWRLSWIDRLNREGIHMAKLALDPLARNEAGELVGIVYKREWQVGSLEDRR